MSIISIDVPKSTRTHKARYSADDLTAAVELLEQDLPVSDGVLYDETVGKQEPRTRAYYAGWHLRNEIVESGLIDEAVREDYRVKTFADETGFRFALVTK